MPSHSGPNTLGEENLVLGYDLGNLANSYKGAPTINFIAELGDPTEVKTRGEFGQYYNLVPIFETHGLVPYTLSMEIKGNIPGSCLVYMQNGSYSKYGFVGTSVNITTEWQRFSFRNKTPSGPTSAWEANTPNDNRAMLATYTVYGSGRNPSVRNMQLEFGAYETPFTPDVRSATESLLDITGNSTIDLTNAAFDSEGLLTFDGTDDTITITPRKQYAITEAWTTELVFKPTVEGDNSWNGLFGGSLTQGGYWMFHAAGNLSYYEGHSTATGTKITYRPWNKINTFTTNQYHHLTICYIPTSSTTGKFDLYYNGGEKVDSFNWTFDWSYSLDMRTIGNAGGDRHGTNDIHYFKQYSKTLTADEVAQNFKSVKSRFNIS
jgi:hypothetical protein